MYIGNEALDLQLTLMDSAQCFHWAQVRRGYAAVIEGTPVILWREADGIYANTEMAPARLRHYLDLKRDYAQLAAEYASIPQAKRAIELYPGLRVMNQPSWEALIAFILSANNNVGRIRKLVQALCRALGQAYCCDGAELYGFPSPRTLADAPEELLRSLGVGYRAPYLRATARAVLEGFPLDSLRDMAYEDAHRQLKQLSGVGDKVADCVLLFGCEQSAAFPVDVWVERLLQSWFDVDCTVRRKMAKYAREKLGRNAGIMQQFLFHAARMGDIEL